MSFMSYIEKKDAHKNINWFFLLYVRLLAFNILFLLEFHFMQNDVGTHFGFTKWLASCCNLIAHLFPPCLRWHLHYILIFICTYILYYFYSFIYLYINTPTLPFNYYSFIIHLMPGRIFSPFSLVFKNFLGCFRILFFECVIQNKIGKPDEYKYSF